MRAFVGVLLLLVWLAVAFCDTHAVVAKEWNPSRGARIPELEQLLVANESECLAWKTRALRLDTELQRARSLIRKGGFYDRNDERALGVRMSATDVLQQLLTHATRIARSKRCSRCVEVLCSERDFEVLFPTDDEADKPGVVALQNGRHVTAGHGCEDTMRLVSRILREERVNKAHTRTTRRVVFSSQRVAHIIDEDLDSGANERDAETGEFTMVHHAVTPDITDDPCAPEAEAPTTVHFDVGRGSTRHYMLHLTEKGTVAQVYVTVVNHK